MANYAAIGLGGSKNADDGTITVKATIRRMNDGKDVETVTVTAANVQGIQAKLEALCQAKADADNDQVLSLAIVGKTLATSK